VIFQKYRDIFLNIAIYRKIRYFLTIRFDSISRFDSIYRYRIESYRNFDISSHH